MTENRIIRVERIIPVGREGHPIRPFRVEHPEFMTWDEACDLMGRLIGALSEEQEVVKPFNGPADLSDHLTRCGFPEALPVRGFANGEPMPGGPPGRVLP